MYPVIRIGSENGVMAEAWPFQHCEHWRASPIGYEKCRNDLVDELKLFHISIESFVIAHVVSRSGLFIWRFNFAVDLSRLNSTRVIIILST